MATKSSDDPMDLGGFMQNFVLSNPFKDMQVIPSEKDVLEPDGKDLPRSVDGTDKTGSSSGSSPGDNVKGAGSDVDKGLVIAVDNGQVLDTPKAHVGSNVVFAAALKLQKVSDAHAKVQKWLKNNYIHEPSYPLCKDARELIAEVQEHFPHITNMTLSKIMTFTFPNSVKVTNISGFHGYKGLLGKPQPEDYCNLDLLKAVSHCKLYGSISEAAQMYNVPVSSVASLHYWHPDLASLPVHLTVAEELSKSSPLAYCHTNPATGRCKPSCSLKCRKGSVHSGEYCDCSDCLTDPEDEQPVNSNSRHICRRISNKELPSVKMELQEKSESDMNSVVSVSSLNDENGMAYSLLRSLLKQPRLEQYDRKLLEYGNKCKDEVMDLPGEVAIKSEPVSSGYEDCDGDSLGTIAISKNSDSRDCISETFSDTSVNSQVVSGGGASSGSSEVAELQAQVKKLKTRMSEQEIELLLSRRQVLRLKSALCTQEVTIAELSQDFDNLHQQFSLLKHKFKRALDHLDREHSPPAKRRHRPTVNGNKS